MESTALDKARARKAELKEAGELVRLSPTEKAKKDPLSLGITYLTPSSEG